MDENELIPTRLVYGVACNDLTTPKLNEANRKDPLSTTLYGPNSERLGKRVLIVSQMVLGLLIQIPNRPSCPRKDNSHHFSLLNVFAYRQHAFQLMQMSLRHVPKVMMAIFHDISKNDGSIQGLLFGLWCDASDFAIGAVLGQRHENYFRPIHYAIKIMNEAESHYTTTKKEMLAVVYAFEKF
ncbi:reverse transcriptase domain-containing protein [Tanacetum coccineum]